MATDVELRSQSALRSSPIHALRNLQVHRDGQQLMLTGRVSSFYHKQLAQELVRAVAPEIGVINAIEVKYGE